MFWLDVSVSSAIGASVLPSFQSIGLVVASIADARSMEAYAAAHGGVNEFARVVEKSACGLAGIGVGAVVVTWCTNLGSEEGESTV